MAAEGRGFVLPATITDLVLARDGLRQRYGASGLAFTFDGKLVGDIGEAVAAELFGIELEPGNAAGIDGHAPDGRSVQVKATGTSRGPAFRRSRRRADHFLFLDLDFNARKGVVVFNGPLDIALSGLSQSWSGQRPVALARLRALDELVEEGRRLARVDGDQSR